MKKLLLVLLLLINLIPSVFSSSLRIGFDAGYALNFLDTRTPWKGTEYLPGHGADIELTFEYFPLSWLSVNTALRYVQKDYNYREIDFYYDFFTVADYVVMNHFIELPLALRFYIPITEGARLFIGGGGFVGFWAGSNAFSIDDEADFDFTNRGIDFEYGDNRFSAGVIGEAGFAFSLTDDVNLLTAFKYEASLTSLESNEQRNTYNSYNDTFLFTLGAQFRIGG